MKTQQLKALQQTIHAASTGRNLTDTEADAFDSVSRALDIMADGHRPSANIMQGISVALGALTSDIADDSCCTYDAYRAPPIMEQLRGLRLDAAARACLPTHNETPTEARRRERLAQGTLDLLEYM